jgi:hypothetical protein
MPDAGHTFPLFFFDPKRLGDARRQIYDFINSYCEGGVGCYY